MFCLIIYRSLYVNFNLETIITKLKRDVYATTTKKSKYGTCVGFYLHWRFRPGNN